MKEKVVETLRLVRTESQRDAGVIYGLQQQVETLEADLGSAQKALKGQARAHAAELEGVRELYGSQVDAAQERVVFVEVQYEEQRAVVERLEAEVLLLGEEKAFCLQLVHDVKSEARARVSVQQARAADAKACAVGKGKELQAMTAKLAQSQLDKVASRQKFVSKKEGTETQADYRRWGARMVQDALTWTGMTQARVLESCRAVVTDLETREPEEVQPINGETAEQAAIRQRAFRASKTLFEKVGSSWETLVSHVLEGCSSAVVSKLMSVRLPKLLQEGNTAFMSQLREFWSMERLLDMKLSTKLSRRNYTHMRNCLFKVKNKATGQWEDMWIGGVLVTPPAGEKALRSLSRAIASEYGLKSERHGSMTYVAINKVCAESITAALVAKQLKAKITGDGEWEVTDAAGNTVVVQEVFDKAYMARGMSHTACGVAFPNSSKHPCSPQHTNEFAVAESGDDWEGLRQNLSEPLEAFNELNRAGEVTGVVLPKECTNLDEDIKVNVKVTCTVGADQSGCHSGLGLGPCNSHCSCPYCEIEAPDLLETNQERLLIPPRRSLFRISLLAHLITGVCPGCKARIVATKEELCGCNEKKKCGKCNGMRMMLVAKRGDKVPAMRKVDLDAWLKQHFGVRYAQGALIEVEPGLWVICILHMNLRITGNFFAHCVLKELGRHTERSPKEREEIAKSVWGLLSSAGLPVKVLKCPKNEVESYWESISKYSFAGDDCAVLASNDLWLQCVDLVMPQGARDKNYTLQARYQAIVKGWRMWNEQLWPMINRLDFETKKLKADAVRQAAREFIPLFKAACVKAPRILYLHLLVSHLPEQIENLTVDPYFYQTQGLEHRHKLRKAFNSLMCNGRKPGEQRTHTVAPYQWVGREKSCPEFQRKTGTSRTEQVAELVVVKDHLCRLLTGHVCDVARTVKLERENELKKAAWKRRQHALQP